MTRICYVGDKFSAFTERDTETLRGEYNVELVQIELSNSNYSDIIYKSIRGLFGGPPDVYFIYGADGHAMVWILIAMIKKRPTIVEVYGYEVCKMPEYNYGLQLRALRGYIVRWVLQHADAIVTPSDFYAERTRAIVPGANVVTVYNYATEPESVNYNKKLQVVMVARTDGVNAIIKGLGDYQQFARAHPTIPFYCIGRYDDKAKQIAPDVTFTGELPHKRVLEILSDSKVYCQTSRAESFGVACLEALQRGCLVVTTMAESLRDVVGDVNHSIDDAIQRTDKESIIASVEQSKKFTKQQWVSRITSVIKSVTHE